MELEWSRILRDIPLVAFRTVLLFVALLVVMRFTGKRTIHHMAPFDLALVIMVGEVASIPIAETRVPLVHGLLPALLLGALHVLLSRFILRSRALERLTEGVRTLVVKDGQVLRQGLRQESFSEQDLMAALRQKQVEDVGDVQEAWLEHSGALSVILKPEARPITRRDLERYLRQRQG